MTRGIDEARATASPWFARATRDAPRARIFCFAHAGAGAAVFRPWRELFPPDVEICAVRLPGREKRIAEPAYRTAEELLPPLLDEVRGELELPYGLFGHCSGALIAFSLASALISGGAPAPGLLCLSGQTPPDPREGSASVAEMSLPELIEHVRTLGGMDPEILEDAELLELLAPLFRADFELAESLASKPRASLPSPVSVFAGRDDAVELDGLLGWRHSTTGSFTLRLLTAGHFYRDDEWRLVARLVARDLEDALAVR
jgi:medium-chain acyl-[acyl-carrier-protein] hydrolase